MANASPERIDLAHCAPFVVGTVKVDPAHRTITGNGQSELVEPRVLQVLVALARARGEVLSRDDLVRLVWDGRAVGENAIHRAVSRVRAIAAGQGGGSFSVETIPGVGYALRSSGQEPAVPGRPFADLWARRAAMVTIAAGSAALLAGVPAILARESRVARDLFERAETARRDSEGSVSAEQAAALYRAAIEEAPKFVAAWGGLALAYCQLLNVIEDDRTVAVASLARSAARQALAIDPGNHRALVAQALVQPAFGRWAALLGRLEGLERKRRSWEVPLEMGRAASDLGRPKVAARYWRETLAREPLIPRVHGDLFHSLWITGRLHEAEDVLEQAVRRWPRNYYLWSTRFLYLAKTGQWVQAAHHVQSDETLPLSLSPNAVQTRLTMLRLLSGERADGRPELVRHYLDEARWGRSAMRNSAIMLAMLGEDELVQSLLDGYFRGTGPFARRLTPLSRRPTAWLYTPVLDAFRRTPDFRALTDFIGLPADPDLAAGDDLSR